MLLSTFQALPPDQTTLKAPNFSPGWSIRKDPEYRMVRKNFYQTKLTLPIEYLDPPERAIIEEILRPGVAEWKK